MKSAQGAQAGGTSFLLPRLLFRGVPPLRDQQTVALPRFRLAAQQARAITGRQCAQFLQRVRLRGRVQGGPGLQGGEVHPLQVTVWGAFMKGWGDNLHRFESGGAGILPRCVFPPFSFRCCSGVRPCV